MSTAVLSSDSERFEALAAGEADTGMRLRWPTKYLPSFPAILLVPAVLGLWTVLCITNSPYDWSSLRGVLAYVHGDAQEEPWYYPRGYPFRYSGNWELQPTMGGGLINWTGFQVHWLLIDLIIALTVAYIFAIAVDRLLFPLVRRLHGKKPEQEEPS